MSIIESVAGVGLIMDHDGGNTMHPLVGTQHSDADLIETARALEESDLVGHFLMVSEDSWGWSPRFKHCSNHDDGWGCDNEGEWHRHYSTNYGFDKSTTVTVYPFKPSSALRGCRVIEVTPPTPERPVGAESEQGR